MHLLIQLVPWLILTNFKFDEFKFCVLREYYSTSHFFSSERFYDELER